MLCDLIIEGNFILSKLVFTLHKQNELYGLLERSLENSINNFKSIYPFKNVYLVSDSKEKSWRYDYIEEYKAKRSKDLKIDWEFVYNTYDDVKKNLKWVKVLEYPRVEGDDWISHIVRNSNENGRSVLIISNDYDIKQLIEYNTNPLYINMMTNAMYNRGKFFLPKNYHIFLDKVRAIPQDIFNLNDNKEFLSMIEDFILKYDKEDVDNIEELIVKYISGDRSDNIGSVWSKVSKTGRRIGIGDKGARNMYKKYIEEFGDVNLDDPDLYENIADIICENKKLNLSSEMDNIVKNLKFNEKLVNLDPIHLPNDIKQNINKIYNERS